MTTNVRRSRKPKAQTRGKKPVVQETEQEERVQTLPRRKPRQLAQKVRVESAVVEPVAEIVPEAVVAEVIAPHSEPVKAELPAGVESVADQGRKWRIP
ncbi:ribonuclease, Rne/Rng family [Klebsiella pneumoniae]|uniref:Ribonuclease, Rne/Rng family n=1 Tax=Klebsiella pneumoniae TaxID=573 RepID=A0A447S615_KLEPN|nr:ribonuclease, Rne/Rng family [Klebsiella pneumoniae]